MSDEIYVVKLSILFSSRWKVLTTFEKGRWVLSILFSSRLTLDEVDVFSENPFQRTFNPLFIEIDTEEDKSYSNILKKSFNPLFIEGR